MPTLNYDFVPNDSVWVIVPNKGVLNGTVKTVRANIAFLNTEIIYNIQFVGDVGITAITDYVYGDIDSALAAYKLMLT